MKDKKLSKRIDVAIKKEEEAYAFYIDLFISIFLRTPTKIV